MTRLAVDILSIEDDRWGSMLERCSHDIYHCPRYCGVSARVDGGIARAVLVQHGTDGMLLPFVGREISGGLWDATSPYGYPGPVWTGEMELDLVERMFHEAVDALAEAGCVSLFLRMHPGLNAEWPNISALEVAKRSYSETVFIDLTKSEREIWSDTASGHRNEINRAGRRGYAVVFDNEATYLYDFARLYRANMAELGAHPYYVFDNKYFHDIHEALGANLDLVAVLHDGTFIGGALFTSRGEWVQYHLSAADPAHRNASPAKLVINARRRWGQEQGYRSLHLGGGRGGAADSLFRFKAGFSSSRLVFRTAGIVLRTRDYAGLMQGADQSDVVTTSRFPAYRA